MIHESEEEIQADREQRLEWILRPHRFVRFGQFSGGPSRIGLGAEFVVTSSGGLYDPHLAEAGGSYGAAYEAGLSVYFAHPWGANWIMEGPDRSRANYQLGYGYLQHMIRRVFVEAICAGDVFLLSGDLIVLEEHVYEETPWGAEPQGYTLPVYAVGSDGEPLIGNPRILTRLDVWGDHPALPKLYCCGTYYDWDFGSRRGRARFLMDTLDHRGREDWCQDL